MTYLRETVSNSTSPQKLVTCPLCLQTSDPPVVGKAPEEWVDYLPTSDFLSSYLEAVELKDTNRPCDTCKRQEKGRLADQWCSTCHDALCDDCIGFHNALKTTNGHNLIPLSKVRRMSTSEIISAPLCPYHEGETVTNFCENHHEVVCEKCIATSHKNCPDVKPLPDAAHKHRPELAQVTEMLDDETKLAKAICLDRAEADKDLDTAQVELLQKIQAIKQKVNENLSKCEAKIIGELYDITGREKPVIQTEMKEAQRLRKSTSKVHSLSDSADKYGSASHILHAIPPAAVQADHYKGKLTTLNSGLKNTRIDFFVDPVLEKALTVNQLGELKVTYLKAEIASSLNLKKVPTARSRADSDPEDEYDFTKRKEKDEFDTKSKRSIVKTVPKSRRSVKTETFGSAQFISSFNGRTPSDLGECWFTGVEYLPNGKIVIVDRNNYKIKLFGADCHFETEVKLPHQPFGLAVMSANEIAVTVPRENSINLFTVRDATFTPSSVIKTSDRCYGISYDGYRFFVACTCASPPCIKVVKKDGVEQYEICPEENYYPMFFRPWYVKVDPHGVNIYVSDCNRSQMACIITGNVLKKYTYKDSTMNSPRGLIVLKDSRVILCGFGSDNIQLIDENGVLIKDLLTRTDGIMGPQVMALNSACDTIAVTFDPSSGMGETVKIFRLKI